MSSESTIACLRYLCSSKMGRKKNWTWCKKRKTVAEIGWIWNLSLIPGWIRCRFPRLGLIIQGEYLHVCSSTVCGLWEWTTDVVSMPVRVQSCTISEEYSERFIDKCIENGTILKAVRVANETQMKKAYLIKYHTFTAFTAKKNKQTRKLCLVCKLRTTGHSQF